MDVLKKDKHGRVEIFFDDIKDDFKLLKNDLINSKNFDFTFFNKEDGKRYFFKGNGEHNSDLEEVMGYIIANAMQVKNVFPIPASYIVSGKVISGVISEDFVENRQTDEVINGKNLFELYNPDAPHSVDVYMRFINFLVQDTTKQGKKVSISPEIEFDFIKLVVYHLFSAQQDGASKNINLYVKKSKNNSWTINFAKNCDNGYCSLLKSGCSADESYYKSKNYEQKLGIVEGELDVTNMFLQLNSDFAYLISRKQASMDLAVSMFDKPMLKDYLKVVYEIDLKSEIDKYKKQNPLYKIPPSAEEKVCLVFECSRRMLAKYINRVDSKFFDDVKNKPKIVDYEKPHKKLNIDNREYAN